MKSLKFDDAKNTTFTLKVSFPLPKKMASGKFSANLAAVDQAKADYMCLDIKYSYTAPVMFTALSPAHCTKDSDCPSSYCQNGVCHACGDKCCLTDKDCPGSYCANDPTKMPPYTCHGAAKIAEVAPAAPLCLHHEDIVDHKCFEACNAEGKTFASKGITTAGKCPAKYSTIDHTQTQEQCPDGVTNLRYCAATKLNVTVTTKGLAGGALALAEAQAAVPFTWDSCGFRTDRLLTKNVAVSSSYKAGDTMTVTASGITNLHVPLETGAWQVRIYELGEAKSTATSVGDLMKSLKFDDAKNTTFTLKVSFPLPKKMASGKFSANLAAVDQAKADYMCLDIKYSYAAPVLAEVAPAAPFCLHQEDTVDHKCFEACNAEGKTFKSKGITTAGTCPTKYSTIDHAQTQEQCPDGVTNLRYCAATKLNVTVTTKGEAGEAPLVSEIVEDTSVYCMNDPSKKAPFYCHVPPLPTACKTDKDCTSPWYKSWCMNDPSKKAPYVCKQELPPTCKTDADCKR